MTLKQKIAAGIVGGGLGLATVLIQDFEDSRDLPFYTDYRDIVGVPTACFGETGPHVKVGTKRSKAECEARLEMRVTADWIYVDQKAVPALTPYQHAAFTSFVYNVGRTAFANSTMLKLINKGKITEACNELPKWKYAGGVVIKGLSNRRDVERQICLGIYPGVK